MDLYRQFSAIGSRVYYEFEIILGESVTKIAKTPNIWRFRYKILQNVDIYGQFLAWKLQI